MGPLQMFCLCLCTARRDDSRVEMSYLVKPGNPTLLCVDATTSMAFVDGLDGSRERVRRDDGMVGIDRVCSTCRCVLFYVFREDEMK